MNSPTVHIRTEMSPKMLSYSLLMLIKPLVCKICALIIALPPTPPPLKKGRGLKPAPLGGAGLSPRSSEA
jgi:hypothetical protein